MNSFSSCVDSFIQGRGEFKKRSLGQLWEVERNIEEVPSRFLKLFQYKIIKKKKKNSPLSNELMNTC